MPTVSRATASILCLYVFRAQLTVLQQFCAGKKEHRCRYGTQCGNGKCRYGGHCSEECVDGVYEALQNVDNVLRQEIAAHKHSSKILSDLVTVSMWNYR